MSAPGKRVEVVECTLREGSYVADFRFTGAQTGCIVGAFAQSGVGWIEIGQGMGLGAPPQHGAAAASDEEYIEAAVASAGNARIGCFFIPEIGSKPEIKRAELLGMKFVRIGTNAHEIEKGLAYITYAKELGLTVFSNLMKSYLLEPTQLGRVAKKAAEAGADIVSVVDSAGGLLPEEVSTYVRTIRETVDAEVGFHGHNNLGLANACSLAALAAGARYIDSTLQGLGRSAGNASTESMLFLFERLGYTTGIDPLRVIDIGQNFIRPHLGRAGFDGLEVTSGFALFHSSFLKLVKAAVDEFSVDPRELVIEVSKINRHDPSQELFHSVAAKIKADSTPKGRPVPVTLDRVRDGNDLPG